MADKGTNELMQANPDQKEEIGAQYPDAAFATMIVGSLFNHNRQLGEIPPKSLFLCFGGREHRKRPVCL